MILVVRADSNTAKIYYYEKRFEKLMLIKEITHPESKLKNEDLISDKQGHYKAGQAGRGAYSPRKEPKEVEIDNFAREVARELNHERVQNEYDKLILVSPPHMLGLFLQHFDKNVKDLIAKTIQKDLMHLSDKEFLDFLKKNTQFVSSM